MSSAMKAAPHSELVLAGKADNCADGRIPITVGVVCHLVEVHQFDDLVVAVRQHIEHLVQQFPHSPIRLLLTPDSSVNLRLMQAMGRTSLELSVKLWDLVLVLPDTLSLPTDWKDECGTKPVVRVADDAQAVDYMVCHSNLMLAIYENTVDTAHAHTQRAVHSRTLRPEAHPLGRIARHAGPLVTLMMAGESKEGGLWSRKPSLDGQRGVFHPDAARRLEDLDHYNRELSNSGLAQVSVDAAAREICNDNSKRKPAETEEELTRAANAQALSSHADVLERRLLAAFQAADSLAIKLQDIFNRTLLHLYWLGALINVALWTAIEGLFRWPMAAIYVLAFGAVWWLLRRLRSEPLSGLRLLSRLLAEALRIDLVWAIANRDPGQRQIGLVVDQLLEQHLDEVGWVRDALRVAGMAPSAFGELSAVQRQEIVRSWIDSQLAYSRKRRTTKHALEKRYATATWMFYMAGIACAAGTLTLDELGMSDLMVRHLVAIAAAVFPGMALLFQGYIDKLTIDEEIKSARRMEDVFARAASASALRDGLVSTDLLLQLGTEAINESTFWLLAKRSRPVANPV